MKCRDASNYTQDAIEALMAGWYAEGDRLVILQAFPPSYAAKYAEQQRQIAAAEALGMRFDNYIYDYLGDPTWRDGALDGLATYHPRTLWLDEEDVETERGWTPGARVEAIHASVAAVEQRGYRVGIYTGKWWWEPLTANCPDFAGLPLWGAQYDGVADASVFTPFGNWQRAAVKQFLGSQPDGTDLNVLSPEEEALLMGTPDQPADIDVGWLEKKPAVVEAAGRQQERATQLLAEAGRKGVPRKTVIRRIAFGLAADAAVILE